MKKLLVFLSLAIFGPVICYALPATQDLKRHGIITPTQVHALYVRAKAGDVFSQAELANSLMQLDYVPNLNLLNDAVQQVLVAN